MTATSTRSAGAARWVLGVIILAGASIARAQSAPAGRAVPSACGAPFKPSARVSGIATMVPDTNIRLMLPRGWTGEPALKPDGTPFYRVWAPPAGPGGLVALDATNSAANLPLPQLLSMLAQQATQPQLATFGPPRLFSLGRDCGGQMLFHAPGVEGYVALVRSGEWLYGLLAKYPDASAAAMRAGLDTMVATVRLAPPSSPVAARTSPAAPAAAMTAGPRSVVGCWERAPDAHTMRRIRLRADGTYDWWSAITGLPYNVEPDEEEGRYRLTGNSLSLTSNQGQTEAYTVSVGNGTLTLGSARYAACE